MSAMEFVFSGWSGLFRLLDCFGDMLAPPTQVDIPIALNVTILLHINREVKETIRNRSVGRLEFLKKQHMSSAGRF
ncbi:MAG: hypothetical protein A2158_07855 [Chloroflexi bacterium RBG_13_46_14]|nr:MAG: hypothetical protein A2158_07855 [Chloroflexi bacterium RBG_13_46_14]